MLSKQQKREQFEKLRDRLSGVTTLFLLDNNGLKVNEVNELRNRVRSIDASYKVVKNSVTRLAIEGTSFEPLSPHLTGPKALAFTAGDGVELAKVLREFLKSHPALVLQQAFLEGQVLDSKAAATIADLPSKEQVIAKLLYVLQSPIRRLAVALNAPIQNFVSDLSQVAEKREA